MSRRRADLNWIGAGVGQAPQEAAAPAIRSATMQPALSAGADASPYVLAIGASGAQGLADLGELLAALPSGLPAVIMAVLHRPSDRVSNLQAVLTRRSARPVAIAEEAEILRQGVCYVGEPASHLSLGAGNRAHLIEGGDNRYRNRTIDLLFQSVAAQAGRRGMGVVLSGALDDGASGLSAIHMAGGATMVLGSPGAPAPGMPFSAAARHQPVNFIGSVREIAARIVLYLSGEPVVASREGSVHALTGQEQPGYGRRPALQP